MCNLRGDIGIFAMNWRNARQSGELQKEDFMFVCALNDSLRLLTGVGVLETLLTAAIWYGLLRI